MAFLRSIEKLFVVILCGSLSYSLAAAETTSPFEEETSEVRRIFGETPKVQAENSLERFNFCKDDNLNDSCGVLVTFKGKDGKRSPHFAYFFTHLKRQVGATEYFIQNEDGTYHAYLDDVLDGTVAIDHVYKHNEALEVNFYKTRRFGKKERICKFTEGGLCFPTVENVKLLLHGNPDKNYGVVQLKISRRTISINGSIYSGVNGAEILKIEDLTYNRIRR